MESSTYQSDRNIIQRQINTILQELERVESELNGI
ncbi:hypothetical protein [Nostoc sp.]